MKMFLFVNPASGSHSAQRLQLVLKQLRAHAVIPHVFEVRTPAEIYACCNSINKELEPPLVIVAGGDGTCNAVINGLEPDKATLALLPFGTSNVLAAEIGITSLADALERIIAGKSRSLSVGVIELEGRTLRFLLMAGIGLDGAVVRDVWPLGKRFLRQGAYALSALKRVLLWDSTRFEMSTPKGTVACHTAIICNASRYGGDFILSPDCSPFLPGLSAVCITGNSRSTYLSSALELFNGRAENSRNLTRIHSSSFEIRGTHPIQIDGDFVGYGPARISECVDFARIIV
ncbi:MAG: diacylglycerol/lipid kinase family protein [Desulfuromonadaceae bacterium]